ncbi:11S globulin seed storage protein 2-like [Cornus florida]|uniref:11S globulin seed storage protein 2-like n=1 Tax=Cornus florida TaxID=4283 RepID=UPI00289EDC21|nr:11S globulin seed storage protein 2-like [Cornus florida]
MATKIVLLAIFVSLLASAAYGQRLQTRRMSQARQCRLNRLTGSQPSQRIESEGGVTELWDEYEDQFQCAGVAPMRNTLRPNALSLPNFHPSPRLVYIQQGEGLLSINIPGCAETFHSEPSMGMRAGRGREEEEEEEERGRSSGRRDLHQKVLRIRQGDIIALPAGVSHWCFNDGNEELVAVSINDLNNQANQLDQRFRAFYLAGGVPKRGQQSEQTRQNFQNILRAFDSNLLAEAYNIPEDLVRRLQREDDRGLIVNARHGMSVIRPDENEELETDQSSSNGLEETICSFRFHHNMNNRREADVYSRQAGRVNIVNQHKLPILRHLDLSAERGNLLPSAMHTPYWSMNGHNIVYVIRGDAQVQVVGSNGQTVMNDRVNQGEMFVVPQYFAATFKAGRNGLEYVAMKTTSLPMKNPLAGYTSVIRAMPLQVLTNSYQMSPNEAQQLKTNRGGQTFLLSPRNN